MTKRKTYAREVSAFVGIDAAGNLAFGTIRSSREECAAIIERIAPAVEGFPPPLRIMPVFIGLDLNTQLAMPLDGPQKPVQAD